MGNEKKRPRADTADKPKKPKYSGSDARAGPSKPAHVGTAGPRPAPAFVSSLVNDEGDFPRGGGTMLSAFELKQVREEGRREAEAELAADAGRTSKKPRRQISEREARRKAKNEIKPSKPVDPDQIRVELLNYKRLTVGTRVLARVHSILPLHLVVSLANNLLAHIPITEVSSTLTHLLAAEQDAMAVSDDEDDEPDAQRDEPSSKAPELSQLFAVGQYVSAKVINTFPTASQNFISQYPVSETTRLAARVELSLVPEKVNEELPKGDLVKGVVINGEVKEEEDKGWRIGLGLGEEGGGKAVEGWLVKSEVEKHLSDRALVPGQLIRAAITSTTAGGRVHQLTLDPEIVLRSQMKDMSSVSSIVPGQLVNALVTAVLANGLNVKIGGFLDGTIDRGHLDLGGAAVDEKYTVGKKIRARVLYDNLSVSPRRYGLSNLPHILSLSSQTGADGSAPVEQAVPIGKVLSSVTVIRVMPEWGLICRIDDGLEGFVHISHIADERVPTLTSSTGAYAVSTIHRARVIGHSPLDGVVLLSLEAKVLDQVFMSVSELRVGQILKGTIRRLTDKGLFVDVHGSVDGVVWTTHYADIRLAHPERRFKVGASVKARVLALEPERNRVVLTLKKSLVDSQLEVPASFEECRQGMVTPGSVVKLLDKGLVVELFGGLRAFIPSSEASQQFTFNLGEIFHIGSPVQLKLIDVRPDTRTLTGSIRQASAAALAAEAIAIGSTVSAQVTQIHPEQILLVLQPSQATALLSLSNLSNHREMTIDELRSSLRVGEVINDLVVVSRNEVSGVLILSPPKTAGVALLRHAQPEGQAEALQVGDKVQGKVAGHVKFCAVVQLPGNRRAKLHPCDVSDDFSTVTWTDSQGPLGYNDEVSGTVIKVGGGGGRTLEISTRASRVPESKMGATVKDPEIESISDLKPGQAVRGFVKNVVGAGVFVAISRELTARVMIKEMFDTFVKDWQVKFHIGQLVAGKILSVDVKAHQIEMTLRQDSSSNRKKVAQLGLADFAVGQVVVGVVKKIEPFGVFVRIDGSNVSGLCHKSEITDNRKVRPDKALNSFREGDQVKAKILTLDLEKGRIGFGLKQSYLTAEGDLEGEGQSAVGQEEVEEEEEDENGEDGETAGADEDDSADASEVGDEEVSDEGVEEYDDDQGEDLLDDEYTSPVLENGSEESGQDDDEDDDNDDDDDDDDDAINIEIDRPATAAVAAGPSKPKAAVSSSAPLDVLGGFDWAVGTANGQAATIDSDSDSDSDEDANGPPQPSNSKKAKAKPTAALDLTASAPDSRPSSGAEYERALLASPNSSFLWIQYMSFLLQLHEVERARKIGRSALERIAYREEGEKLNVWMALINLELGFGTTDSAEKVFKEAEQYNDKRAIWGRYVEALQGAGKDELAEETYKRLVKKFSAYPDSWAGLAEFLLKQDRPDEARDLLSRSLKSLDKSKHVEVIQKMAVLEFRHGDPERGKTLFEGVLDRYPKKLDLWSVYIDQLTKTGDIQGVRGVFDRALDRKLTSKKAKFLFKKWLSIESRIGDEAGQENAKDRAKAWVAANVVKVEGDEEEAA